MGLRPLCVLTLCLVIVACAGPRSRYPIEEASTRDAPAAAAAISEFRQSQGLGPVVVDSRLDEAALQQAKAMAASDTLSHTVAGSFSSRMQGMGFIWGYSAENLGMGYRDLASAIRGWKASPGHRQNLLLPQATRIGLARARGAGKNYWALVLASPDMTPDGRPKL
ncbi:MAG: CAP domain-containing protein [Chelatococcus sp.]|uniref:CAP domain-containing protein n=1 Tax=Chelatococcus sp. TaxID=1953771 RepID=UPI0025C24EAC|nr:CAP domain-containing protein [Chelatococcus sp.]MBX3539017.1 CAP domain-containing protein [Chelatococcus sp.]